MKTNYVLIDYENVQVKSLALLTGDQFRVRVFLGKSNTKIHTDLAMAMQRFGDRAEYVMLESSGRNALDFHIAYYLGVWVAGDPTAYFHIISKDTGFDPLIKHLRTRKVLAACSASIEAMSCFDSAPIAVETAQETPMSPAEHHKAVPPVNAKAKPAIINTLPTLEEQINAVIEDLSKRKSARPAKMVTLLNTIRAKIGKERHLVDAEAVCEALIARNYVTVSGVKVIYKLPKVD